jgi:hypothetical protein
MSMIEIVWVAVGIAIVIVICYVSFWLSTASGWKKDMR